MTIEEKDFQSFITIKQNLAAESIRHCLIRFRVIEKWFGDKELTKENVEKFFLEYKEMGRKNNSLNTYYFVFRQLREYCKDRSMPAGFLDGFKSFKKTKADIIIFTLEEIEKILTTELAYGKQYGKDCSYLDFRYRTMTMFLAYTGCRYGEAANLRVKRLDISAGRATFIETKTNENRSIFFAEPLKSKLKQLVEGKSPNDFVFRNTKEKQIHVQDYSEDLKKRAVAAGVTKRTFPHNFRHSYITHMLEAGVPITEVASLAGHKDIQTTYETYMHLADKTIRNAAMRHPLVRRNVDPHEIINTVKERLEDFHLDNDKRFDYKIMKSSRGLTFELLVK